MPLLSTGFVIAGAYADKVRRVLFAQLRDMIKRGEVSNRTVAARAGELNRILYEILVNRLRIEKGDVVRIRIEYEVKNGDVEWKLDTLRVEAFRRVPDDEIQRAVKESIERYEEILASEVTEEEKAWTEAREREIEREVQRQAEKTRQAVSGPRLTTLTDTGVEVADIAFYGETRSGESLALLKDPKGDNVGLLVLEPVNGAARATVIIVVPRRGAYRATIPVTEPVERIKENPQILLDKIRGAKYVEIDREEAESMIKSKLEDLM